MGSSASVPLTATAIEQEAQNIHTDLTMYSAEFAEICKENHWKTFEDLITCANDDIKKTVTERNLKIDQDREEELFAYLDSMRKKHDNIRSNNLQTSCTDSNKETYSDSSQVESKSALQTDGSSGLLPAPEDEFEQIDWVVKALPFCHKKAA